MFDIEKFNQNPAVKKQAKSAQERLEERIIGLGLLPKGEEGVVEYLGRFGKNISAAKCAAIAVACAKKAENTTALCGQTEEESKKSLLVFTNRFAELANSIGGL
jgi:hypothetical protein